MPHDFLEEIATKNPPHTRRRIREKTSKREVGSAVSALLTGMMLVRSQISSWKFNKQHDRPKMAGQVVINKFVFDDFLSAMRCMKPTDALTAATTSVDGIAVLKGGMS